MREHASGDGGRATPMRACTNERGSRNNGVGTAGNAHLQGPYPLAVAVAAVADVGGAGRASHQSLILGEACDATCEH
eukprot:4220913-Pyramimonas_sp.AAC.1